ncbi:efflux RND transporter periplasmic adaptor subunit [Vulgatibacter incomptus]|uniref:efflux RND transporter periplasmic adaptor subunit n=1 Tax=Vulgatibacter incomptus TaxID=1391653 RepID=UPI0023E474C0|nr:efflux RND transporter periplasmic adaptor subunit [Vulgatibacter incomptus]
MKTLKHLPVPGLLLSALIASACGAGSAPPPAPGPVEVGVLTLAVEPVTQLRELPGRTAPFRIAEVRARVNGIVLQRLFEEGGDVKEGQSLFKIDALPYQATLASAEASLARARASAESSKLLAERYAGLLDSNAVSKQEYDNAVAAQKAALADVAAGQAAVQAARINLGYTRVDSPIAGRIGRSEVTEGAYVQQGQATLMATVQQLDPIYVDLTQSSAEGLRLQRRLESGELVRTEGGAKVRLILEDGTTYSEMGTLQFSGVTVNPGTGSITLRALFPNPRKELLPGMFVRARLEEGTTPEALLVPQVAVRRDSQGKATVMVVGAEDKVELRPVEAPRAIGDKWQVTEGLSPGDRVIVEGVQKVRPGRQVIAVPAVGAAPRE